VSRSRAIGSRFAREVAEYLAGHGFPYCERRVDGGSRDRGDIAGVPGVVIECKATKVIDLAGALSEAKKEAANDKGCRWYVAVFKRRNHGVAEAYAVVPLWALAEMLGDELPIQLHGRVPQEAVERHPAAGWQP
jgi:hypothetical protein